MDIKTTNALKIPVGNDTIVENKTHTVTVEDRGNGNKYIIDGLENPKITSYYFDNLGQSHHASLCQLAAENSLDCF